MELIEAGIFGGLYSKPALTESGFCPSNQWEWTSQVSEHFSQLGSQRVKFPITGNNGRGMLTDEQKRLIAKAKTNSARVIREGLPKGKTRSARKKRRAFWNNKKHNGPVKVIERSKKDTEEIKKNTDFYKTPAWTKLRYEVIRMHGKRCMACGDNSGMVHVDHILPRSTHKHLELDINNLQVLCPPCNLGKSNIYDDDWRDAAKQGGGLDIDDRIVEKIVNKVLERLEKDYGLDL